MIDLLPTLCFSEIQPLLVEQKLRQIVELWDHLSDIRHF